MRKFRAAGVGLALISGLLFATPAVTSATVDGPADTDTEYTLCGRVFSDPHAYWPSPAQTPGRSPFAKGNAPCAAIDFLSYGQMVSGVSYLESLFPDFVEFYTLEQDFPGPDGPDDCATSTDTEDRCSAGLPAMGEPFPTRERSDLYMIRVTDERVSEESKKLFVFPLSIHGIERAGAEAGVRAAEDLAIWGFCEAVAEGTLPPNPLVNCGNEQPIPHPLLETQPGTSLMAGDALEQTSVYLVFANPDGWRRGDADNLFRFYQRYNGNGVDMNRDWPTVGFTHVPYTPWSEPETRSFGQVLKEIRPKWDGGIDLHGQLIDRAFSFTLMGASERDYGKDQRILQTVKGAWADAEERLGWSPLIKPNDAPEDDPRVYGVQWGTVWDTINYTVTGAFGDWIDSDLGLGGDGIDNEMSMSHLINCGTGACYLPDPEQLHVDGNKSLVYAMVNFSLLPEDDSFEVPGSIGYIFDPTVLEDDGAPTPPPTEGLPPQPDILDVALTPTNSFRHQFEVLGPEDGFYNGGLTGTATPVNVQGVSPESITSLVLEQFQPPEEDPAADNGCGATGDDWGEVNRYFNQGSAYLQSGQAVHANLLLPGTYRICVTGGLAAAIVANGGYVDLDINFSTEKAWEDPGQLPYSVTNMNFFADLAPFMQPGQLTKVPVDDVLSGAVDLNRFDSLVIADNPFPGYTEGSPELAAWGDALRSFVEGGGNLTLTDGALRNLEYTGLVADGKVRTFDVYAGYIGFTADGGATDTYDDPLASNVDQDGAAEGTGHRHQTYEPVPLGFDIGARQSCSGATCTSPVWVVDQAAWEAAGGRTVGTIGSNNASFGELALGAGTVRIIGALLPMPTEQYYHPFGLANYAVTYSGYQVLKNVLQWERAPTDVAVTKTDTPDPAKAKKPLTYTISVMNNGASTASGVSLTDSLPANTTFVSVGTTQGSCSFTAATRTVACDLGNVTGGQTVTVTIVVKPTKKGTITNTVTVTAESPEDPNTANNTATATTRVR